MAYTYTDPDWVFDREDGDNDVGYTPRQKAYWEGVRAGTREAPSGSGSTFGKATAGFLGLKPDYRYLESVYTPRFNAATRIAQSYPWITRAHQADWTHKQYISEADKYWANPKAYIAGMTPEEQARAYYMFGVSDINPPNWNYVSPYMGTGGGDGGNYYSQAQAYIGGGAPSAPSATTGAEGYMPSTQNVYYGMLPTFTSPQMQEYYRANYSRIWNEFMSGIYRRKFGDVDFSTLTPEEISAKMGDLATNPEKLLGEWQAYLKSYPWEENYINIPASMRGYYTGRYAPRTRWLY